jgi:hypothetical protein
MPRPKNPKAPPPEPASTEAGGSNFGGDFRASNSTVGGRDIIQGVPYDKLAAVYVEMRNIFSTSQLENPRALHQNLSLLRSLHDELYEWKELHNCLDEIIYAMAPFEVQVNLIDRNPKSIDVKSLRNMWRGVAGKVDGLLHFARGIQKIGARFEESPQGMKGERWAVLTYSGCKAISDNLGISLLDPFAEPLHKIEVSPLERMLGARPNWWGNFYEQAENFRTNVLQFMTEADKRLLEKAAELYHLSQRIFGDANAEIETQP